MELHLQQNSQGQITLDGLGLKLEIKPDLIFKNLMSFDARKILNKIIEKELIEALEAFEKSEENTEEFRDRLYQKEVTSLLIKRIAIVERDLVYKLHEDGECIEMSNELEEVRSYAHSVWRYDTYYGYPKTKKYELKNENI